MAVTRIKNNQITDNTIEYQKLKDGTLVGTKFNSNLTLNSNVSIVGNLQVTGNTTTINSINTFINDPLVIFNNGYVGIPSYDVGMLVNRNLSTLGDYGSLNTAWAWSESDGAFIAVLTTETGETTGQINRSYFANIKVGNIEAISSNLASLTAQTFTSAGVLRSTGNIVADSGTTSINYTTGALVVPGVGGVGIGGNLNVHGLASFDSNVDIAGNLTVSGNITAVINQIASFSGVFYGDENGHGALYAGVVDHTPLPTVILQITGNVDSYSQLNLQNVNNGAYASGDIVVTADDGTDTTKYIDLGIAGSGYNYPGYEILKPHDGYLNVATGNLVFYLFDPNKNMYFYTGGTTTTNEAGFNPTFPQMTLEDGVGTLIQPTTASVDKTTGALRVLGGVGILGNLHAGAINTTPIGNTNPSTAAFTTLTSNGATTFTSSAASTTSSEGAVVVTGGVGIGGNLNIGSNLTVTGNTTIQGNLIVLGDVTTLNTATLDVEDLNITVAKGAANPAAANGAGLTVDGASATILYLSADDSWNFNKKVNFTSADTTVLSNVNITSGNILNLFTTNLSTANAYITGGNITNISNLTSTTTYTTNFSSGNTVITGGYADNYPIGANVPSTGNFTTANTIILNVTNGNVINLYTQNFSSGNAVITGGYADNYPIGANVPATATFTTLNTTGVTTMGGNLVFSSTTINPMGSSTQGALVIPGPAGAAIGGNLYIGSGLVINGGNTTNSTLIRGVVDDSLFLAVADPVYDQVVIGGNITVANVIQGAKLHIDSKDALLIPKGFNADRPSSIGFTDVAGMIRFSLTTNTLEYYNGATWVGTTISYNVITSTQFSSPSGDPNGNVDGSNAVFTLPAGATTNGVIVSINGVVQLPTVAYSIGGAGNDTLTFTEAPALGDVIDVRTLTTTAQITNFESTNGFNSVSTNSSNVKIATGSSSTSDVVEWNAAGAEVNLRANVTVASSGSPAVVDSFAVSAYSSAEYTVTASIQGTDIRQISKVVLVTDGATTSVEQYSNVCTAGNSLVSFSGGFSSGSAQLRALTTNNNTIFRISKLYQPL